MSPPAEFWYVDDYVSLGDDLRLARQPHTHADLFSRQGCALALVDGGEMLRSRGHQHSALAALTRPAAYRFDGDVDLSREV